MWQTKAKTAIIRPINTLALEQCVVDVQKSLIVANTSGRLPWGDFKYLCGVRSKQYCAIAGQLHYIN